MNEDKQNADTDADAGAQARLLVERDYEVNPCAVVFERLHDPSLRVSTDAQKIMVAKAARVVFRGHTVDRSLPDTETEVHFRGKWELIADAQKRSEVAATIAQQSPTVAAFLRQPVGKARVANATISVKDGAITLKGIPVRALCVFRNIVLMEEALAFMMTARACADLPRPPAFVLGLPEHAMVYESTAPNVNVINVQTTVDSYVALMDKFTRDRLPVSVLAVHPTQPWVPKYFQLNELRAFARGGRIHVIATWGGGRVRVTRFRPDKPKDYVSLHDSVDIAEEVGRTTLEAVLHAVEVGGVSPTDQNTTFDKTTYVSDE